MAHFCGFGSQCRPPLLPIFAGSAVVFVRRSIIFGLFCRFDGRFLPSGRHFCLFLLAQRSFLSAGPSFSAFFVGLTVVFFRQAAIFAYFCWLSGRFCPPVHHFCPFLLARRLSWPPRPAISAAGPSFSAFFVGLTVVFFRQAIIFWGPFLSAWRRLRKGYMRVSSCRRYSVPK